MKKLLLLLALIPTVALAETRVPMTRNAATRIRVKFVDATTGGLISGATGMACKCKNFAESSSPADMTTACSTAVPAEVGTSGIYYLPLTAAETNNDYLQVLCTSSSGNAIPYEIVLDAKHAILADATNGVSTTVAGYAVGQEPETRVLSAIVEQQGNYSMKQALSVILAVAAGETPGLSGGMQTIKTSDGVALRVTGTVNPASGARSGITLTPSP